VRHPEEGHLPNAWDLSPGAAAERRAELEIQLRRRGVQPYTPDTPERAAELRAAYPPPPDEEIDAYFAALGIDQ